MVFLGEHTPTQHKHLLQFRTASAPCAVPELVFEFTFHTWAKRARLVRFFCWFSEYIITFRYYADTGCVALAIAIDSRDSCFRDFRILGVSV